MYFSGEFLRIMFDLHRSTHSCLMNSEKGKIHIKLYLGSAYSMRPACLKVLLHFLLKEQFGNFYSLSYFII